MKYGMRKPSWKKSLSARTKGRATRAVKKALIPGYGKKGMGWLHTDNVRIPAHFRFCSSLRC